MSTVLVTGGSGFIAGHTILQLLAEGHEVRTSVRSLQRTLDLRARLSRLGGQALDRLSFVIANLERDGGWPDAVADCEYVLHMASPFPAGVPKHAEELIVPAREGTLRVLRAARDAGVRRVVLTSSFAAIGYGHPQRDTPFDESVWTNLEATDLSAYTQSKTLAERAAWDFIAQSDRGPELVSINPVMIFGPVLDADLAASTQIIKRMLDGSLPGYPKLHFGIVDVRDVADLHLRAMTHPAAKGERFLATAGDFESLAEIARIVKRHAGEAGRKVPTRQLPDWLVRAASLVSPSIKQAAFELGKRKNATSTKARTVLGWSPRSNEDAIAATAESLLRLGIVKAQ
jgi:nucleoside-diphosphate-sugar epimerase